MTQVSKKFFKKDIENRVYEVLLESIASATSKGSVAILLEDLLSPTEKLMLAKRLSIALLLTKGYNQRAVSNILNVGLETINRVSRSMQKGAGGYAQVTRAIIQNEKLTSFLQKIDDTLADILPPRHRDWSSWRRERWEAKVKATKPF